jgi:CubicO group peptidase (beta-lactamase class C family)
MTTTSTVEQVLQRTTPESQGIASAAILRFIEAVEDQIRDFHSFMLLRHGKVVAEGWWSPYQRHNPHMLFSLSKSFTSTAVGLAIHEGWFSIDDKVVTFFPGDIPAQVNEHLAAMEVRHLLSMSTGQAEDSMSTMTARKDMDWAKGFFDAPIVHKPGTHFLYNTGATYMLSAIIQKTTGLKLIDFLEPRLFRPLGFENPTWEQSPQGINTGGFGLSITTEEIARFGQLYLQKGMWGDQRLIPEAWVEEATTSHISNGTDPDYDWAQGYGYQFWRCRHGAYRGDGAFGQYCVVMPRQDAVLVITAGLPEMQQPLNLVWEMLLPAMGADALPDDPEAHDQLTSKLSSLHIPPLQSTTSPAAGISGKLYTLDTNPLKLESFLLTADESGCVVRVRTAWGEERFACGYGQWQHGETRLFNEPWNDVPSRTVASGGWTAQDTLTMVVRLHETPFFHTLHCHFEGNKLKLETIVNVGFTPPQTLVLTGHSA